MSAPKKRQAEENTSAPPPKRPATRKAPDVEVIEDNPLYNFTPKLHAKFAAFPALLRSKLQQGCQTTCQRQWNALFSGKALELKHNYSIIAERRIRQNIPNPEENVTRCHTKIKSLSVANAMVLDMFTNAQKEALKKPQFIQLETQEGMVNQDFIQLYAVRHGEIGWGLDTNGCLSLYTVFIDKGKLKEYVIYVQRADIKVEEKD